jgi:chromosome segregation ATPase
MFNLFTNNTAKDIIDSMPKFAWKLGPTFYIDEKEYTIRELIEYVKNLIKENNDLEAQLNSIEKDGTEEHNNAIKLREENVELKKILIDLKEENTQLMDRVNEIDSDQNEEYRAEILTLKNECALLRAKNNTLQEFIDTKIKVDWKSARIDILERDLQKCAEQRDEFKHQLNAANKENEKLKKDIVESEFNNGDPIESVYNLLKKAKELTEGVEVDLDKSLDDQGDKQPKNTLKKVHMSFPNEVSYEWEAKPGTFTREVQEFEECKITGYKVPKEKSWEEAASDLALRVAKLEEHIKYMPKVSFTDMNEYVTSNQDGF